ncbi:MAG: nitrilase-related carbon-nitrogen hydrolase [Blastocatellia bacterium]
MNVVCVQLDCVWENKQANHEKVARLLDAAQPKKDSLVVLPEMFASGFSMNVPAVTDSGANESYNFLAQMAQSYGVYLMAGIVTTDASGKGRNESVTFAPDGTELARYCKLHPFTLGGELDNYVKGEDVVTFNLHGFVIAPFICYDLRFPEAFRAATVRGANVIAVIASWPKTRHHHWVKLLHARAIENEAYVIGVNRCGWDPKLEHAGGSVIIDPQGNAIADAGNGEGTITAELQLAELLNYREKLPFLADIRRDFLAPGRERG